MVLCVNFGSLRLEMHFCLFFFIGGKRDEELILPLNSSLSATLNKDEVGLIPLYV